MYWFIVTITIMQNNYFCSISCGMCKTPSEVQDRIFLNNSVDNKPDIKCPACFVCRAYTTI